MRIFVFSLVFFLGASLAGAQTVPEVVPKFGPETAPPSAEDFNPLPEELPDGGGQVVVEDTDPDEEKSRLDELFADLSEVDTPKAAERIARNIQLIWMASGSDTVDVLMARAGKAIQAEEHGLALDLLDTVVILRPSYAEGWNRRATVHYMREDFGKSLVDIERTLALEPRHWGALSGLAIIQRRLGFEADALATFRRALEVNPGLENAAKAVEALEKDAEGAPA